MSISLLAGQSTQQLPTNTSATAKKSEDAAYVVQTPTTGEESAATSLTLSQDSQLIAPPEANGNADDAARSHSNIEAALIATLGSGVAPEEATSDEAQAEAMKSDQAKQAYEAAMRGPIAALADAARGEDATHQDPFAAASPTLSMVA